MQKLGNDVQSKLKIKVVPLQVLKKQTVLMNAKKDVQGFISLVNALPPVIIFNKLSLHLLH